MDQDKVKRRVVRFLGGIAFTVVFIIFAIISISVAPHSSDINGDYSTITNYHRGAERKAKVVEQQPAENAEHPAEAVQAVKEAVTEPVEEAAEPAGENSNGLPDIDINSWEYVLVNDEHTISADFRPAEFAALNLTMDETDVQIQADDYSEYRCLVDSRIGENLRDFALACKEAGLPVYLSSGYRRYTEQQTLYQNKIGQYNADVAKYIVAEPGTSEHQTGLCCDITDYYHQLKDSSLENTDTFKWLNEHCTDYGFVLRYPKDKSGNADDLYSVGDSVTHVIYEPWHFRYVGVEAAKYMTENNLTLEEFVALYA